MSLNDYSLDWSEKLIGAVEVHLRDIHSALLQYYDKHHYSTEPVVASRVSQGVGKSSAAAAGASSSSDEDEDRVVDDITASTKEAPASRSKDASSTAISVVAPVGSFLLRTCVHSTPFPTLHQQNGVGADLVITIPESKCTQQDLQQGDYLARREAFLEEIEAYLCNLADGAVRHVKQGVSSSGRSGNKGGEEEEDNNSGDEEAHDGKTDKQNKEAAARLARMEVERLPMHGAYANSDKPMLRLRFRRHLPRAAASSALTATTSTATEGPALYEIFHVNVFFRPAMHAGRVTSAAAIRKHPLYSYHVLEDYLMPQYMKRLHELCVESTPIRRAVVILKCWAHHVGLMSASSGHGEGLNGFVVTAMVAALAEVGILSPAMSEDNMVRTVWVQITRGFFQSSPASLASATVGQSARPIVPIAEEKSQVAVLRLAGDAHNVLFRTSNQFWESLVKPAAEEALRFTRVTDLFARTVFQPLALRYDTALTLTNITSVVASKASHAASSSSSSSAAASAEFFSQSTEAAFAVQKVVEEALRTRCTGVLAWQLNATSFRVVVRFVREAEGRSRITRGPAIEDVKAVEAFNDFWGREMTSARQFPDGAVYRCVLWTFPAEDAGTHTTIALSAPTVTRAILSHAIRRHVDPAAKAEVLLGGLEGFLAERVGAEWRDAAPMMQKSLLDASRFVSDLITSLPKTALPCKTTGFDIIAASERGTEVFPVRPHLALTYTTDPVQTDAAFSGLQTVATIEPIHCVLTIDDKHSIPDTTEAIAMMKGAICAQLAKYLQQHHGDHVGAKHTKLKANDALATREAATQLAPLRAFCTSQSVDVVYRGYLFRIYVAHYREISLLRALKRDAEANVLEQKLFWSVQHTKLLRTLAFGHHSYGKAVRLAKRWVSAMMLYEFISPEVVELLVAHAYLGGGGDEDASVPKTPAGGFLRFVQLIATHDWTMPLVLPFTDEAQAEAGEGTSETAPATGGAAVRRVREDQGMFIATSYAPTSSPFTESTPRPMIVHRLVQLAKAAVTRLVMSLQQTASSVSHASVEADVFLSDPTAFDLALRFHPQVILQPDRALWVCSGPSRHPSHAADATSATRSDAHGDEKAAEQDEEKTAQPQQPSSSSTAAQAEFGGPAQVSGGEGQSSSASVGLTRLWQLDELQGDVSKQYITQLAEREPAAYAVRTVRAAIRDQGMLFYDALAPYAVHVVALTPQPVLRRSHRLHEEVLRASRGALLPAPPSAFTVPAPSSSTGKAREAGRVGQKAKSKTGTVTAGVARKASPVARKGPKAAAAVETAPRHQKRPRDAAAGQGASVKATKRAKAETAGQRAPAAATKPIAKSAAKTKKVS